MKLHEKLPDSITVDGRRYRLRLDFRNVLELSDEMARDDLLPQARVYRALRCVMRRPPRDDARAAKLLEAVKAMLFPQAPVERTGPKITDINQDADMIRAAFLQEYGIDLWTEKLHWLKFSALLASIPEGTHYADVLGIRARPMPHATKWNQAEREWLAKAKAAHALEMDEKEQADNYDRSVKVIFEGLIRMAGDPGA
jgi:hypothetical protein